jgi:hypothetical protein
MCLSNIPYLRRWEDLDGRGNREGTERSSEGTKVYVSVCAEVTLHAIPTYHVSARVQRNATFRG